MGSTKSPVRRPTTAGAITISRRRGTHTANTHCQFTCRIQLTLLTTIVRAAIPCLREVTERQTERKSSASHRVHPSAPALDLTWSRPHNTYTATTTFFSQCYMSSTYFKSGEDASSNWLRAEPTRQPDIAGWCTLPVSTILRTDKVSSRDHRPLRCLTNRIIPIKKEGTIIQRPNYQRSSQLQIFFQSATRISPTTM